MICLGGKGKCSWFAYCAYMAETHIWQLRRINDKHKCSREFNVKMLNAKWLSGRLENTLRDNPSLRAVDIRNKVTRKWNIAVTKNVLSTFNLHVLHCKLKNPKRYWMSFVL